MGQGCRGDSEGVHRFAESCISVDSSRLRTGSVVWTVLAPLRTPPPLPDEDY